MVLIMFFISMCLINLSLLSLSQALANGSNDAIAAGLVLSDGFTNLRVDLVFVDNVTE